MKKLDPQPINEAVRNALSKLKDAGFSGPEELAQFLKKEGIRFSAHDLIIFGQILATRFGHFGGMYHISYHFTDRPELTGQFADAAEAIKLLMSD